MSHILQVKYETPEIEKHAPLRKAMEGDAGLDLYNATGERLIVAPYKSLQVYAGISIKLPSNTCALVYPRSSAFVKKGLFVVPGLIDEGYTGKLFVIVWNPNLDEKDRPIIIEPWDRLGQLLVLSTPVFTIYRVDQLPETERGEKGFGSTG